MLLTFPVAWALRLTFAVACALLLTLPVTSATAAGRIALSPLPGTPDASPQTQISVSGVPARRIEAVEVTASRSGRHQGVLRPFSAQRGASFVLSRPLTEGERVSAIVRIRGGRSLRTRFTVARLAPMPPTLNLPVQQPAKLQHFVSRPDLTPPKITVLRRTRGDSSGDIFITPLPSPTVHPESNNAITIRPVGPGGPMIIDRRGQLVWFHQLTPPVYAINFRLQTYAGHHVLTWWQGTVTTQAFGEGEGVIADPSYSAIRTVRAGNGYPTDLHEFTISPEGDALFTVYSPIRVHLPGTPAGTLSPLLDSIVQQVDIRTGLVEWEWHAYGHIPLRDSYATAQNSADFDAFHINSIEPEGADKLLVSARDTSAVYLIDRPSGRIAWTLGGKASSFRLGRGARFYFQHDAGTLGGHRVSLFDDEAGPPLKAPSSRGLVLALDLRRRRATLLRQYRRPGNNTSAQSEGSVQQLPGGNVFVGFGSTPFFSEFSSGGRLTFDASLPADDGSYREFTFPWNATPTTRPAVAARRRSGGVDVYVSWNGATRVARWQVLGSATGGPISPLATAPRRGFETHIALTGTVSRVAVRALASDGRVLAQSAEVQAR